MIRILYGLNAFVWGLPALAMILGVGIYLTVRTRAAQFRLFPGAISGFLRPLVGRGNLNDRSKQRALFTALAATVGTGNLAGVAGAIALGGPGAVFWMWICALLGMVTKLAEAALAVHYRKLGADGTFDGGPMYMILGAMKKKWHLLAYVYCFFGVVASLGVGNGTQVNTVVGGFNTVLAGFGFEKSVWLNCGIGIMIAFLVWKVLSGGAGRIGAASEKLVPIAAMFYTVLCLIAIFLRTDAIPAAFYAIVKGAFCPQALTGGVVGSFFICLRIGAARGVFTNEAGMGTASMAHATARVSEPIEQGMMGIVEVFIDTIVICTLTALVILCSGVQIPYGTDVGISLTVQAFTCIYGQWVSVFLSAALCLFAFATVLGWGLYGIQCTRFLFGDASVKGFVLLHACIAVVASLMQTETLWLMAETVNGLMAIPNLIVLAKLAPQLCGMVRSFEKNHLLKQRSEFLTKQVV